MPYMSAYEHRVEKRAKIKGRQEGRLEGRMEGREEGREEGRMEGWEEGLREGKLCILRQIVLSQLGLRFGPLDEHVQQVIAAGTVEDLERQIMAVLEAKSIEDVIGSAKH
jgi:flagellar biosynthesis/type III secretory pathway protein FliH